MGADNKPSETPTPATDAIIADCKNNWGLSDRHQLSYEHYDEARCISTPTGAAVVVKHARQLERSNVALRLACERALAIEKSVTQGQERELREGYVDMLKAALQGGK